MPLRAETPVAYGIQVEQDGAPMRAAGFIMIVIHVHPRTVHGAQTATARNEDAGCSINRVVAMQPRYIICHAHGRMDTAVTSQQGAVYTIIMKPVVRIVATAGGI